ncbi:MAG: AEC family transporter [Methylophaga sp.]|nr:AEC family transporter [Methylophaga sp.]
MLAALLQMALLIACGVAWKHVAPQHISVLSHRRAITDLVFYILLPALVLNVIWTTPLNSSSLQISFLAMCGVSIGLLLMWLALRFFNVSKKQTGTLLLAAAFPNATYLGLPVLNQVIGEHSLAIVLQYDLFACTPILLSFGMLLAHHYGDNETEVHPLRELVKIPPLWAVALGVTLNLSGVEQPEFLNANLSILASAVVPLMMIVLGMSIRWDSLRLRFLPLLSIVAAITLIIVPLSVFGLSHVIDLAEQLIIPVTLIAAMPTMIFGIVICERYQLDSELYAAAVTLTTITSLLTLTVAFYLLSSS